MGGSLGVRVIAWRAWGLLGGAWGGRGAGGRLSLCVCNAPLGLGVVFIDCCLFIVVYLSLFIDFLLLPTLGLAPAQGEAG